MSILSSESHKADISRKISLKTVPMLQRSTIILLSLGFLLIFKHLIHIDMLHQNFVGSSNVVDSVASKSFAWVEFTRLHGIKKRSFTTYWKRR